MPRARLGAVPHLVPVPCTTSDKILYVTLGVVAGDAESQAASMLYGEASGVWCRGFVEDGSPRLSGVSEDY